MSLTSTLAGPTTSQTRENGQHYYRSGAVHITKADASEVTATIDGKQPRQVRLLRQGEDINSQCDCPFFKASKQLCSHIYAALLAAERKGYFQAKPAASLPAPALPAVANGVFDEDDVDGEGFGGHRPSMWKPPPPRPPVQKTLGWRQALNAIRNEGMPAAGASWPADAEVAYLIDADVTRNGGGLVVELAARTRKKNGDWSVPKSRRLDSRAVAGLPDPADRQILAFLSGSRQDYGYTGYSSYEYQEVGPRFRLSKELQTEVIPLLCRTGRCFLRSGKELQPLRWDDGPPWTFQVQVTEDGPHLQIHAVLTRGAERMSLSQPVLLVAGGLVFTQNDVARLDDAQAFNWLRLFRTQSTLVVPAKDRERWLAETLSLPTLPPLELPEKLRYETVAPAVQFRIQIKPRSKSKDLEAQLFFRYDPLETPAAESGAHLFSTEKRLLIRRDRGAEQQAIQQLHQLGFRQSWHLPYGHFDLSARHLPKAVQTLTAKGWLVEADGKLYRQAGDFQMEVRSGIDWFELHGGMEFGDQTATLPQLLEAVRKGENTVRLGDGTFGMVPEEWLKKHGLLAGTGQAESDHVRFSRVQVGLLDALLAAQPETSCDEVFERARAELHRFEGIPAVPAPAGFVGQLRGYQEEGLGWLHFLQRFGFGGCLADDMGLGKTVMVLALLEARRQLRAASVSADRLPPSLAVVPRSLIFNWKSEAQRFAPQLRVLDHTGVGRLPPSNHFDDHDLILTTYGTLRRDIAEFKDRPFDYCLLDEAQAIKNARTDSAKAVRLLQARQRLVLSGTPVENHLGELWSLLDFLNPGMLGTALRLEGGWRNPSSEARLLLARALRPVILRRTKEQVAKDLPAKTEQTVYCELDAEQRRLYNELRDHYRQSLLSRVQRDGIQKSKMHILEALLRLRQAACHPGLIDKKRADESSGKLEALLPQLAEVVDGGHKALVFSQFTSLLGIVRDRLDEAGTPYVYLDGRTRDRQAKVDAFQNDPACKLFLISLKAGGVGLNLTAAEYVFLLDPWWNPAVEAQAIDRAHRIGQDKPVFAYRLIAKDTVEEKVLELQQHKRTLADAIISADNSLIRDLGREDLELLLS